MSKSNINIEITASGATRSALTLLLSTMDVPGMRLRLNIEDLRWMNRNLGIRNGNHEHINEALMLVDEMLKEWSRP